MENIDFESLMKNIDAERAYSEIEKQIEEMTRISPQLAEFFHMGRLLGRFDIVRQLMDIVEVEQRNVRDIVRKENTEE